MGFLIGLVCGVIYSVGGLIIDLAVSCDLLTAESIGTPGLSFGSVLAFGALIGMPILMGLAGFGLGLIGSILYNLYARRFKGLELKFE